MSKPKAKWHWKYPASIRKATQGNIDESELAHFKFSRSDKKRIIQLTGSTKYPARLERLIPFWRDCLTEEAGRPRPSQIRAAAATIEDDIATLLDHLTTVDDFTRSLLVYKLEERRQGFAEEFYTRLISPLIELRELCTDVAKSWTPKAGPPAKILKIQVVGALALDLKAFDIHVSTHEISPFCEILRICLGAIDPNENKARDIGYLVKRYLALKKTRPKKG